MKIYEVGGAVRDTLLGLPVKDRDFMVIGASPEAMLAQGFIPVGRHFPVFLHPKTHEEYALARTERKTAPGHQGFEFHADPSVTLEEDLSRRDLTINAIAKSPEGELIDPYHGQQDLTARILRHVSPAFAEDPLRILRLARFRAYLGAFNFSIADETLHLLQTMVKAGVLQELSHERIWQEMDKALHTDYPQLFFTTLEMIGARATLFPHLSARGVTALQRALPFSAPIRFAALSFEGPYALPLPREFEALCQLTQLHHEQALRFTTLSVEEMHRLFKRLDPLRRPLRFLEWLDACACVHPDLLRPPLMQAQKAWLELDRRAIVQQASSPSEIEGQIQAAEKALLSRLKEEFAA